jgi:hypothetical protein
MVFFLKESLGVGEVHLGGGMSGYGDIYCSSYVISGASLFE